MRTHITLQLCECVRMIVCVTQCSCTHLMCNYTVRICDPWVFYHQSQSERQPRGFLHSAVLYSTKVYFLSCHIYNNRTKSLQLSLNFYIIILKKEITSYMYWKQVEIIFLHGVDVILSTLRQIWGFVQFCYGYVLLMLRTSIEWVLSWLMSCLSTKVVRKTVQ